MTEVQFEFRLLHFLLLLHLKEFTRFTAVELSDVGNLGKTKKRPMFRA